jgi:hypothetical protein
VNRLHLPRADQVVLTALAAVASFFTLLSWQGLAESSSVYLVPLFWVCVVTGVLGLALRTFGAPLVAVPLVQALAAFLILNARWASEQSIGGVVPTRESVAELVAVITDGAHQAALWPAPVPPVADEFGALMLAIGIVVVLLVDLLACTLRRVPAAGLPLLAAFTVPVSIVGGVSWVTFAIAALSFTLLLTADQAARLGRWGHTLAPSSREDRAVVDNQPHQVRLGTLWPSATRFAVAGVAIAVFLPALLPQGLDVFGADGPGDGTGEGNSVTLRNPIVSIQRRLNQGVDVPLVTVKTDDPDPGYLRLTVLDDFDGTSWRPSERDIPASQRADGPMPAPPGLAASTPRDEYTSQISVSPTFDSIWLPLPYPTTQVRVAGDWRYGLSTLDLLSTDKGVTTAGLDYAATGDVVHPTAAQMVASPVAPSSIYRNNIDIPSSIPPWILNLAKSVTARGRASSRRRSSCSGTSARTAASPTTPPPARAPASTSSSSSWVSTRAAAAATASSSRRPWRSWPARWASPPGSRWASWSRTGSPTAATSTARTTCTRGPSCTSREPAGPSSSRRRRTRPRPSPPTRRVVCPRPGDEPSIDPSASGSLDDVRPSASLGATPRHPSSRAPPSPTP